jgi:hypothetical protein
LSCQQLNDLSQIREGLKVSVQKSAKNSGPAGGVPSRAYYGIFSRVFQFLGNSWQSQLFVIIECHFKINMQVASFS